MIRGMRRGVKGSTEGFKEELLGGGKEREKFCYKTFRLIKWEGGIHF